MIKVALVRGRFFNEFEGQNYIFDEKEIKLTAISSLSPIHKTSFFNQIRLPSLADLDFIGSKRIKYSGNRLLGDSQILFGLERLADRFDIFHTADPHYYYSYQLARLRSKNIIKKLMVTSWETIPFNNETVGRKKFIKYFTLKQADYFICHTDKAKRVLIKEGVDEKKISLVRLGVDINMFKTSNKQNYNLKQQLVTILFVGRLVDEKGILDLYEAFKDVRLKNGNLNLKIIGKGYLSNKLRQMIINEGLSQSVAIERKIYKEMPNVYQQADILVLPSKTSRTWEEQYGMVLVEAMASGLPIVAYDSGAIKEIVGKVALLVRERDINDLTKSIVRLSKDNELRLKLGKMGRERVEKYFDARRTASKIGKIYNDLYNA